MSDAYKNVKSVRLTFKGGEVAAENKKKNKKKRKVKNSNVEDTDAVASENNVAEGSEIGGNDVYTIDAAKKMKYEQLFPVESKKFGYDPANRLSGTEAKTVEQALDDRVKKKADRYCK